MQVSLVSHVTHVPPRAFFLPLRNNDVRRSNLEPGEGILRMILSTFEFVLIFRQLVLLHDLETDELKLGEIFVAVAFLSWI